MSLELALFSAASQGFNEELIQILEKHEVNINVTNNQGMTPLMIACLNGHVDCIITLLRHDANVNMRNSNRETALMLTIYCDFEYRLNVIKMLIICGASVNAVNNRHESAIMLACQRGLLDLVKLLHHYHASLLITDIYHNTLLHHACIKGDYALVVYLIELGVPLDKINKFNATPLSLALEHGHKDIIHKLLTNCALDKAYNKNGDTLLHLAVEMTDSQERKEIALMFINNTTNIDVCNNKGKTALMIACENKSEDLVEAILNKCPDTSLQDYSGNTCLTYALENKDDHIINLLMNYDHSIIHIKNTKDEDGFLQACSSTIFAVKKIYTSCFNMINLNRSNNEGNTGLHLAVISENTDIVKYLLSLDVDPRIINNKGEDVLTIALSKSWRTDRFVIVKEIRRFFLKECVKSSHNLNTDICSICFSDADEVMLSCGHIFHIVCMLEYIDYLQLDARCPLCRQNVLE